MKFSLRFFIKFLPGALLLFAGASPLFSQVKGNAYRTMIDTANAQFMNHNYKKAISLYSKLIKKFPDHAFYYERRGICFKKLKKYHKALKDYNKAILLKPLVPVYYYNRSLLYSAMYENDKSFADIKKGLSFDLSVKDWGELMTHKAFLYIATGDSIQALLCYDSILRRDSLCIIAMNGKASLLLHLRRTDEAMTLLKKSASIDSSHYSTFADMAFCCNFTGEYQRCIDLVNKYYVYFDYPAYALNNRGYAKMKLGDMTGAAADFEASRKLDPSNSYLYYNLGLFWIAKGDRKKGCAYFKKSLSLGFTRDYGNSCKQNLSCNCN